MNRASWVERLRQSSRDARTIVGGLVVLLVVLLAILVAILRARDLPDALVTDRVVLFVLWYTDAVLILAILFVLARSAFKLIVERHRGVLGSRLRTKLVVTYVGLALVPGIVLFLYAASLLQGSIERWFAAPVQEVVERGHDVAQAMAVRIENDCLRAARRIANELEQVDLADASAQPRLNQRLSELRAVFGLEVVAVYDDSEFVLAVVAPQTGLTDLPEPGREFLTAVGRDGEGIRRPNEWRGRLVLAAAAAHGAPRRVAVVGSLLDAALAADTAELVNAHQRFLQFEVQKGAIKASHQLTFLLVTLLILLAASWTGLYIARRLTVPLQALAEATRRVSQGDLETRVEVAADDELELLVGSFNQMTAELQRHRELREQGNRELRQANTRLAEERALLAAVLENVAAGVVSFDAEGRIFLCNGAALQMLKQTETEVLGRLPREAWSDPDRRQLVELLDQPLPAAGGRSSQELRLLLAGAWRTFEVKVSAMAVPADPDRPDAPNALGRVVVLEDLTELIRAQQLATWSEAARRIAHEIRNPLTPIRLAAERLQRKQAAGAADLDIAIAQATETIVREVETMKRMVDEFARFARMPLPQPREVDLRKMIEDAVHLYRGVKPGVGVTAIVEASAERARCDAEQIRRVLLNLLDNAVEASSAPGSVTIVATAEDGRLRLRIADSGRGIPAELKAKLFLPYFSTKGRGSGLGLAIVDRIVSDHQGTIEVEDNTPQGTVFTIELPQT
jgi:two-component system, NtrC family, nitrogen regulation sensor histidine kinase NtrY